MEFMPPTPPIEFIDAIHVRCRNRSLCYFGGCNYLGLSFHPKVQEAFAAAAREGPLQTGASRATTGEHPAYRRWERKLARFFQVEECLSLTTGYLAPIAAAQALRGAITHVLLDAAAHPCVVDAARITGVSVRTFAAADPHALQALLQRLPPDARPLVACDGTYGTRGGASPVDAYLARLPKSGYLLVDDAHGAGTIGPRGRGLCARLGLSDPRLIQTISLAKAFGVTGGAILGSSAIVTAARGQAGGWIGSAAPLLSSIPALETALELILARPGPVDRLQSNVQEMHELLPDRPEVIKHPETPVVGLFPGSPTEAIAIRRALWRAGIFPSYIHYPGTSTGFFRFAVMSGHTRAEIRQLAAAIR